LKILHVNFSDSIGGAAIAVNRLHSLLIKKGYNSNLLVNEKNTQNKNVFNSKSNFILIQNLFYQSVERKIISLIGKSNYQSKSLNIFPTGLAKKINNFNADVVNLHWIGNAMISIKEISKIKSKLVWTMHSMWPFSCIDHLSDKDDFSKNFLNNNHKKFNFIEKYVWSQKIKYFKNLDISLICSSKSMMNKVSNSYLFREKKIKLIPLILNNKINNINLENAKRFFNNNKKKYKICCIAESLDNPNKRINELIDCIDKNNFFNKNNSEIVLIGDFKKKKLSKKEIYINHVGKLSDEISKQILISSVDVVCLASKSETFGQTSLEAISLGVPCVIFENLGAADYINHEKNGYIAKTNNFLDFSDGISWSLKFLRNKKKEILNEFYSKYDENEIIEDYINFISS